MKSNIFFCILLLLVGLLSFSSSQVQQDTIEILVLRNPDNDPGVLRSELTDLYADYGSVQLNFDFESAKTSEITLDLLQNINPDILFLPNLYSGDNLLADNEIDAILVYTDQGHSIVGSHGTLEHYTHAELGPLFGLNQHVISATGDNLPILAFSQEFKIENEDHPIFLNVESPYLSLSGATLTPEFYPNTWSLSNDILQDDVNIQARSTDYYAAILTTENSQTRSVYFTHYPSQNPNEVDLQLLYNAFLWSDFKTGDMQAGSQTTISPVIIPFSINSFLISIIILVSIHRTLKITLQTHQI